MECLIANCSREVLAKGLCSKHYQRQWRGDPLENGLLRGEPNPIRLGRVYAYLGIPRNRKLFAETVIDLVDVERVQEHRWSMAGSGYIGSGTAPGRYLHRYLTEAGPKKWVDHINGDILDNRQRNLRVVEPKVNVRNSLKSKLGPGYRRGVAPSQSGGRNVWKAQISMYVPTKKKAVALREMWEYLRDRDIESLEDLRGLRVE